MVVGSQNGLPALQSASQAPGGEVATLDGVDLAILRLLAADARLSHRALARTVGMSAPAVALRVARLEGAGVIRGYRAEIDRALLGYPLVVYIGVVAVQGEDQSTLVTALREMPEVEDVSVVTGPKDLLVRLRLRDQEHLKECLFDRVWSLPGVDRTETFVALGGMEPKAFDAELLDRMIERVRERTAAAAVGSRGGAHV
jgi:Lrp/AsnC family transcriptional regulator, leucine-responsive regulatory protein